MILWRGELRCCELLKYFESFVTSCSEKMLLFSLVLFILNLFGALSVARGYEVTLNTGYKMPLIGREKLM